MTAGDVIELCSLVRPRIAIPVHYEGWSQFSRGRGEIDSDLAGAPEVVRRSFRVLPIGGEVGVPV
jgi:hypothetical protein